MSIADTRRSRDLNQRLGGESGAGIAFTMSTMLPPLPFELEPTKLVLIPAPVGREEAGFVL
jgi:hypothetical protein